jgi:hypothetical protein
MRWWTCALAAMGQSASAPVASAVQPSRPVRWICGRLLGGLEWCTVVCVGSCVARGLSITCSG